MPPPTSPAEADKLQADRLDSLRKRYAAGKTLTAEQLSEIGLAPKEPAELRLEEDPEELRHELTWYADSANLDIWDADLALSSRLRRLKAWRTSGRRHQPRPDMPPLDDPSQLAGWWARVIGRRCPAKITALAAPPPVAGAPVPASAPAPTKSPPPPDPALTLNLADMGAGSLAEQLDNLRRAAAGAQRLYFDAVGQARTDADARQRNYKDMLDLLRKIEKDVEEQRIRNGELIEKSALSAELQRVHTVMAASLNTILGDEGLPAEQRARIISRFFAPLREGKFDLAATAPDLPPPPPAELTPAA
jgi:hypothetical protein